MKTENNTSCHVAFEAWINSKPYHPEIKWIGHSYANAYMAAQWEGFLSAYVAGTKVEEQLLQELKEHVEAIQKAHPDCQAYHRGIRDMGDIVIDWLAI